MSYPRRHDTKPNIKYPHQDQGGSHGRVKSIDDIDMGRPSSHRMERERGDEPRDGKHRSSKVKFDQFPSYPGGSSGGQSISSGGKVVSSTAVDPRHAFQSFPSMFSSSGMPGSYPMSGMAGAPSMSGSYPMPGMSGMAGAPSMPPSAQSPVPTIQGVSLYPTPPPSAAPTPTPSPSPITTSITSPAITRPARMTPSVVSSITPPPAVELKAPIIQAEQIDTGVKLTINEKDYFVYHGADGKDAVPVAPATPIVSSSKPMIASLSKTTGIPRETISIHGDNFHRQAFVLWGEITITDPHVISQNEIKVIVPKSAQPLIFVRISNPDWSLSNPVEFSYHK